MLEAANSHIGEMMGALRKEMGQLAPSGYGQRERSNQEKAAMWRGLSGLPEPELRSMIQDMAARSGHSPFEETPCEVCNLVAKYGLGIR